VPDERYLVTGGTGCIGSWVVRDLVRESVPVTVLTSHGQLDRLRLIMSDAELARVEILSGDITDLALLEDVGRKRRINRIVHLAGMQMPLCAADPVAGARVNVEGTVAMFELARRLGTGRLVYASSAGVYGPKTRYADEILPADAEFWPTSWYGVFKVANEQGARIAWETRGIASVGLRPHSVYGPGRDRGLTSKPTVAMIAAAAGRSYRVAFGGRYQFQYAGDAARTVIAAARAELPGAPVFSLPGPAIGVDEVLRTIESVEPSARDRLTFDEQVLPLPAAFDGRPLEEALGVQPLTPLEDAVRETIETYRAAISDGRVGSAFLDQVLAG
jgi:nucleoside-diphosphate-sugar epimerase